MSMTIQAGFTGSNFAEQFRPKETPSEKVDPNGEIIEGTEEVEETENEAADSSTEEQTDKTETDEAPETADVSTNEVLPKLDHPKKTPLFDPKNAYEKAIAKYLEENASEPLLEKIHQAKTAGYDIHTCFVNYIREEARKMAKDGCAMVEDKIVYGWAVHYFEDEWQKDAKKKAAVKAKAAADKAKAEAEKKAKEEDEAARIAAMTPEERELEQRAKDEAAAAEAQAAEEAKMAKEEEAEKAKAEKKALKKLEKDAYEAFKSGDEKRYSLDAPDWTDAQNTAIKAGQAKAKAEAAAAKKAEREAKEAAKARAEAAQGDLFAGLFN